MAARQLEKEWGVTVTPIIGGTPGYTSIQSLHTLEDVGIVVRPDFIVIAALWSDLFQTETPIERSGGQKNPLAVYRLAVGSCPLGWAPWVDAG